LWGRRRTAYTPELNPHRLVTNTRAQVLGCYLDIFGERDALVNCRIGSGSIISDARLPYNEPLACDCDEPLFHDP
jgi:hypothetical protein